MFLHYQKNVVFFGGGGFRPLNIISLSRPPKGTSLRETASYEACVKMGSVVFAVGEDKKKRKGKESYN